MTMTDLPVIPTAATGRAARTLWGVGLVRARDLRGTDLYRRPEVSNLWLEVLDVYAGGDNESELHAMYPPTERPMGRSEARIREMIRKLDNPWDLYVLVRHVDVKASTGAELNDGFDLLHSDTLIEVQIPVAQQALSAAQLLEPAS